VDRDLGRGRARRHVICDGYSAAGSSSSGATG
jgi:hypothetical protein